MAVDEKTTSSSHAKDIHTKSKGTRHSFCGKEAGGFENMADVLQSIVGEIAVQQVNAPQSS